MGMAAAGGEEQRDEEWAGYDRHQRRLLTEAYVMQQRFVDLPGVETRVDLQAMTHHVHGVDRVFRVRGRMDAHSEALKPLAPALAIDPATFEGQAMRAGEMKRFVLRPQREYTGSEEDRHFRIAEAQFLRSLKVLKSSLHKSCRA